MVDAEQDNISLHLSAFEEEGYNPYIVMSIEKGLTDMLPMDLRYPRTTDRRTFRFNWRTYLCSLFCDLETSDRSIELYNGVSVTQRPRRGYQPSQCCEQEINSF